MSATLFQQVLVDYHKNNVQNKTKWKKVLKFMIRVKLRQ